MCHQFDSDRRQEPRFPRGFFVDRCPVKQD
jgi:hypothetical protein